MFPKLKQSGRLKDVLNHSMLQEESVERVETYKYLGVVFDSQLEREYTLCAEKRLMKTCCLRQLSFFGVSSGSWVCNLL